MKKTVEFNMYEAATMTWHFSYGHFQSFFAGKDMESVSYNGLISQRLLSKEKDLLSLAPFLPNGTLESLPGNTSDANPFIIPGI